MNQFISRVSYDQATQSRAQSILSKIDIFGVGINIKFNEREKHQTKLGGAITLLMLSLLAIYSINLFQQIIHKNRPQVFYQQEAVEMPNRYDLTSQNFQIAIALLDSRNQPFLDEEIYTLVADLYYKVQKVNSQGVVEDSFERKFLKVVPCRKDQFQDPQTQKYFTNLKYSLMYCIEMTEELYLVGQFDAKQFSRITFYMKECTQSQTKICKDPDVVKKAIAGSTLQVYYTNRLLNLQNKDEPFTRIGQTQFWTTNYNQLQNVSLMYMNNHIIDDIGFFSEQLEEKVDLLFSSDRVLYTSRVDESFYIIKIYLEKNKENFYRRTYLRFNQAISMLGGYFNVLFALGCLLSQPFAKMQLHKLLINQTFSFSKKNQNNEQQTTSPYQCKKEKYELKTPKSPGNQDNQVSNQIDGVDNTSRMLKHAFSLKLSSRFMPSNQQESNHQKTQFSNQVNQTSPREQINPLSKKPSEEKNQQSDLKIKSESQIEPQQPQVNGFTQAILNFKQDLSDFFYSYFNCLKSENTEQQQVFNFCMNKVYHYTDICFIVNKLIELEKLKSLLLDSDQIKLFEYIPKPKVNKSLLNKLKQLQEFHKKLQAQKDHPNNIKQYELNDCSIDIDSDNQKNIVNILTIQNRSMQEKAIQAQKAFQKIVLKHNNQSALDRRLIALIGKSIKGQFDDSLLPIRQKTLYQSPFLNKNIQEMSNVHINPNQQDHQGQAILHKVLNQISSEGDQIDNLEKEQLSKEIEELQLSPPQFIYNSLMIQQFPHQPNKTLSRIKVASIDYKTDFTSFPLSPLMSSERMTMNNECNLQDKHNNQN